MDPPGRCRARRRGGRPGGRNAGRDHRGRGIAPTRTCVGCRTARPTDALLRVVRQADGRLTVSRTAPGRGAWLCRDSPGCLDQAVRRRAFQRAFGAPVDTDATDQLRANLGHASKQAAADVRG